MLIVYVIFKIFIGFRNGIELRPIAKDDRFDFKFQEYVFMKESVVVRPGDTLTLDCTYNTTELKGSESANESCLAFIYSYPEIDLSWCKSYRDPVQIQRNFGASVGFNRNVREGRQGTEEMDEKLRQRMLRRVLNTPFRASCSNGQNLKKKFRPAKIISTYEDPVFCK